MASRARFETNKGLLTLSRGTLTLRNGETGSTETYTTVGEQAFAPRELFLWKSKTLSVEVYANGDSEVLVFEVLKTPREIRAEGIREFAPKERGKLRGQVDNFPEDSEGRKNAQEALAAFEVKYAEYLPKSEKKSKKKARKSSSEKEEN